MKSKHGHNCICPESISSPRLILKPVSQEYAQIIFTEFTPQVTRYMTPRSPTHLSETQEFIADCIRKRTTGDDFVFVILDAINQDFIGVCGVHGSDNPRLPEFGIWTKTSAHGRGYGREAMTTLHSWCCKNLDVDGFVYPVDRNNISSCKIPESLGGIVISEGRSLTQSGGELDEVTYKIPAT
jgi:ribosomal-protein-alanine N-acetyltransferase